VVELDPTLTGVHANLGNALVSKGDVGGAVVAYQTALELDPDNASFHNSTAWDLVNTQDASGRFNQVDQAVAWARRANELQPDDADYQNTLGVALYRGGQWRDASEALLKSIELGNEGPSNWLFLAMANWQLDQKESAQKWYD
jgi:Flp pilus assembly protein TadD